MIDILRDPWLALVTWLRSMLAGWGLPEGLAQVILFFTGAFVLAAGAMFFDLFLIWLERKLIGRIQDRLGPNRVGPWGIFQSVADMLKIFIKEHITPTGVDKIPYNLAPILTVAGVLLVWAVIPFSITMYGTNLNAGLLYVVAVGAIGDLGIILAGWGSNNKYALLGGFRSVAQLLSYEVPMVISLLVPVLFSGSLGMNDIIKAQNVWFILLAPVPAMIFFITSVAEVGRAPFDLPEAESEIVAGFNIEYSGLKFGMFFVADFLHAFTISLLFATFFLGGWRGPWAEEIPILGVVYYIIKTAAAYLLVIVMRAALPRFRIDQVMNLNWKILTPMALAAVILTALVDKLITGSSLVVQTLAMLVLNGIILVVTSAFLRRYDLGRLRKQVAAEPRPLARPPAAPVQPETGAQA
jgi:NADH-quinone oxidoreductase subunit H